MSEHAVIVEFHYGQSDLNPLFSLEDRLRTAIESAGCGEYDGHEIAMDGSDGTLYMYGPNADKLFEVVEPILRAGPFMIAWRTAICSTSSAAIGAGAEALGMSA